MKQTVMELGFKPEMQPMNEDQSRIFIEILMGEMKENVEEKIPPIQLKYWAKELK